MRTHGARSDPGHAVDSPRAAGWLRLWRHSLGLGWRWLLRESRHGLRGARVGVARLLVPLDPWRFYELGRVAESALSGRCLDLSSPKLLPSLLHHEGRGEWTCVDLYLRELRNWHRVDPALPLQAADATALPFADAAFDHCVCVSVVEHLALDGDAAAMAEIWRVLRPGGELLLTTNVARESQELWREDRIWGRASVVIGGRVFYERHYSPADLDRRLLGLDWSVVEREFVADVDPKIHARFVARAPWSYLTGRWLRRGCPGNFVSSRTAEVLPADRHGVVFLRLRKPGAGANGPGD